MNSLLAVHRVRFCYSHSPVLDEIDFSVAADSRLAIMGSSGSGKTTLLRLVAGLLHPMKGQIERVPGLRVGMVFQDLALWPNLTALENVTITLVDTPRNCRASVAVEALERCRIADFANRFPGALSVGQQQRLALARAIASGPQLLLLDEPFSSLDIQLKSQLYETVQEVVADRALILVTHDLTDAMALCNRILLLEAGKIADDGSLVTVLKAPKSEFLSAHLRTVEELRRFRP